MPREPAAGDGRGGAPGGALAALAVSVRFGGLQALDQVDLVVAPRMITGLIGPNGAGKTTMFNVLTGLVTPTSGGVHLDADDISRWPPHRRGRAGIARTFQRLELFRRMSVEENMVAAWEAARPGGFLGRGRRQRRQRVAEVVELLELGDLAARPAGQLSTGQGRMVELGRALCTDPRFLLLDEPSSGLDQMETARFRDVLLAVASSPGGPAVLLVEHDMALVMEVCDVITVLDFGRRIAVGTPPEIQHDPVVRAAYLGDADVA